MLKFLLELIQLFFKPGEAKAELETIEKEEVVAPTKFIAISAGHNPRKKGASCDDFNEYDEAIIWQRLILDALGDIGIEVPTGSLTSKIKFVNESKADIALEIHFNSIVKADGTHTGSGCETLYCPGSIKGKDLAEGIQLALSLAFSPNRGAKEGWYRMDKSSGIIDAFLKKTRPVSVIIEPEFVHHAETIRENRERVCTYIAKILKEELIKL